MKRILFIGNCGFQYGLVVGGAVAKSRVIYRYCVERHDVSLIDTYYEKSPFLVYIFKRYINKPYLLYKVIKKAIYSETIILCFYSVNFIKLLNIIGCTHKIKYIAIGGIAAQRILAKEISLDVWRRMNHIYLQSQEMVEELEKAEICNASFLANCKYLPKCKKKDQWENKKVLNLFYLGQIRMEKGIGCLVDAMNLVNKSDIRFELFLYGDVFENFDISKHINEYIHYEGKIDLLDSNENYDVLKQYDIFVFPTEWLGEGLSGAVIDALALGKPVIATRHNLNDKMVIDGKNGFLFEKRNIGKLVEILDKFYNNQQLIVEMGNQSLSIAEEFRAETVLKQLEL